MESDNKASLDVDILSVSSLEEDTVYIDEIGESTTDDYDYDKEISKYKRDSGNDSLATVNPPASSGPAVDNLAISSSQDVTIGNQTYFQGTVIIKNLLTTNDGQFGDKKRRISITSTINITAKKPEPKGWIDQYIGGHKRRLIIIGALIAIALSVIGLFVLVIVLNTANNTWTPPPITTPETTSEQPRTTPSSTTRGTVPSTPPSSPSSCTTSTEPPTTTTEEPTTPMPFTYVPHRDWSNRSDVNDIPKLTTPVRDVVIGHTFYVNQIPCQTKDACKADLLRMEYLHRETPQIPPNFMLGGYEEGFYGRGYDKQPSIRGDYKNEDVFFVAVLGDFNVFPMYERLLDLFWALMRDAVEQMVLSEDYKIYLECQFNGLRPTSPGLKFIEIIKTWPRWSNQHDRIVLKEC